MNDDINSLELFSNDYLVFRHDRVLGLSNKKDGGGVLIAVKTLINCKEVVLSTDHGVYIEMLAVTIELKDRKLIIMAVYFLHWAYSVDRFNAFNITLRKLGELLNRNDLFMVLGDFNPTNVR